MRSPKRRSFTLLEICISIAIIAMIAGMLGTCFKKGFDDMRYQNDVRHVVIQFKELQSIAMAYQADIEVSLEKKGDVVLFSYRIDEPQAILKKKHTAELKSIQTISFDQKQVRNLALRFLPSGKVVPEGIICLQDSQRKKWINLKNPLSITVSDKKPPIKDQTMPERPKRRPKGS